MDNSGSPFLSVVVPAYNEEGTLPQTIPILTERLSACVPSFELIVVDDASRDRTRAIAEHFAANDSRIRAVHHSENQGIGAGFCTGLRHACGEWLILIPADLALDPTELPRYFDAAQKADVVVGLRSDKCDYSMFRLIVSWANIFLIHLLFGMQERQFQYISLYRTRTLREIEIEFSNSAFFLAEILIKAKARGYRLTQVEIHYLPRQAGRATGANWKLILHTVQDMFTFWQRGDWRKRT